MSPPALFHHQYEHWFIRLCFSTFLVYSSQTNVSFSFKGFSSSASPSFPPEFWGICLRQTLSPLSLPCIHLTSFSLHSNHYFFHVNHYFFNSNHYCFPTKTQLDRFCPLAVPGDGVLWNSFWRSIDHKRWQNGGEVVKARARPSSHKFDAQLEVRTFENIPLPHKLPRMAFFILNAKRERLRILWWCNQLRTGFKWIAFRKGAFVMNAPNRLCFGLAIRFPRF